MRRALLKKQMLEVFAGYFYNQKKKKKRSKAGTIAYFVFFGVIMIVLLGGIFTVLSVALGNAVKNADLGWLYYVIMSIIALLLGVFGSVFNTYAGLYIAKDNDLLLSMPISVNDIMAARLMNVYLMGAMYAGVVLLPAMIVYWIIVSHSVGAFIGGIVMFLVITLLVFVLSCLLGWVVAKISLKLKNKSFITVILTVVLVGGYYFLSGFAGTFMEALIRNIAIYGGNLKKAAYGLYFFGSIGEGNYVSMAVFLVLTVVLTVLTWYLLASSFIKMATATGAVARKEYKEKTAKQRGFSALLLAKEFGRFTSSPTYMLNCGLGILVLPVGGIFLLIKGGDFVGQLNALAGNKIGYIAVLAAVLASLAACMNDISAPSVSLEGKCLWIMQSLPVSSWQVLRAKLQLHLLMTELPLLVFIVCVCLVLRPAMPEMILMILIPIVFEFLMAQVGLILGLKLANLNWTNETVIIKQSAATVISMFGGWVLGAAWGGLFIWQGWKIGAIPYMAIMLAVTVVLALAAYIWLKKRGTKVFESL